jgi:hypothetical protein
VKAIIATITSVFALIGTVWGSVTVLDGRYVIASQFEQLSIDIYYAQFYDRLDDYEEALAEGRPELAEEYKRQMERIKAKICEADPQWERCDNPG